MAFEHLLSPRSERVERAAGFWRRTASFIADILLLDLLVLWPFTSILETAARDQDILSASFTNREMAAVLLVFAIIYVYFVLFEYILGQTLGMMLFDMHIAGGNGVGAMLVRNAFIIPVLPLILFWIVEPVAVAWRKRGVLEYLSGTRTVHRRTILI